MRSITAEWVSKAEADFGVMEREWRARKNPSYDAVCFHAQQCAEKYLKGRLAEADITFDKTHALVHLLKQALPLEPAWEIFREDLGHLTVFAVMFRYPGVSADKETARDAVRRCREFRRAARAAFGLPVR